MNAYELADELQELDAKLHLIVLFKSAEMLRQQADRIAELESGIVAIQYTCPNCQTHVELFNKTPQTKPLSDEEILNEWLGNDRNFYYFARAIEERHGIK